MEEQIQQQIVDAGAALKTAEVFEDVSIDKTTGRLVDAAGERVLPDEHAGEEYDEVPMQAPPGRPRRSAHGRRMPAKYVTEAAQVSYKAFVTVLFMAGLALTG
jgi:hypothetical protein